MQHVWTVAPPLRPQRSGQRDTKSVAKGATAVSLQRFDGVASCVSALRVEGWDIWAARTGRRCRSWQRSAPGFNPGEGRRRDRRRGRRRRGIPGRRNTSHFPCASLSSNLSGRRLWCVAFDWYPHFVGDLDERAPGFKRRVAAARRALPRHAPVGGWLDAPNDALGDAAAAAAGVSCRSWAPRKMQEAERAAASSGTCL